MADVLSEFQILALTPAGLPDPAIAIAATRAGEIGVLDLELTSDIAEAEQAIAVLDGALAGPFGVKLSSLDPELAVALTPRLPQGARLLILTPAEAPIRAPLLAELKAAGRSLLFEVDSLRAAEEARRLGADAVIAKGSEAAGWIGEQSSFVLLQALASFDLPVYVQGGVGLHTIAGCYAAGARGVVVDAQLLLTRESPLPRQVKTRLARLDGTETLCAGNLLKAPFRVFAHPSLAPAQGLARLERELLAAPTAEAQARWRIGLRAHLGWAPPEKTAWPVGQDICLAKSLAERFVTVGGVLAALRAAIPAQLAAAERSQPLAEDGALARRHGCRFPVVQGPMTRVSDRAEFALRVAEGGGLPFLALALMRGDEVAALLAETDTLLGPRPWGVGLLGFVPQALREEQLAAVRAKRPPHALIAGGRPDQAAALEADGISTYLHVPTPGLLRLFLKQGARKLIFEGRECGGHVGPLSSFVLWNGMIEVLLSELSPSELADCQILFAGGIHDALSAAMVSAIAAPLAERGAAVGVLMGTAYLFTHEAVSSGAIVQAFQDEAIACASTVLLESGPGHATRCLDTEYARAFEDEKRRLLEAGRSAEEIRHALEALNIGRLRIAAKGVDRNPIYRDGSAAPRLVALDGAEQRRRGMYMIGQAAALRRNVCSIAQLHADISRAGTSRLLAVPVPAKPATALPPPKPAEIAIVGMSTILPGARRLPQYWSNILDKHYAITEIPAERWDHAPYFDPDPAARDKIYSKWGGFIEPVEVDPAAYGMPPRSLRSIDPVQILALQAAREALEDAGYWERPFDRRRTSVILGASGGIGELGGRYVLRSGLPQVLGAQADAVIAGQDGALPEWSEDSFAGLLLNVAAGRIANRLDLGGSNFVVDAACASSLAAVDIAARELETGTADMVIAGGVDTTQNPFGYLCFSKTHALSPSGRPRTFDAEADGIVISEGVTMLVLKRLADAERDGDRVYALIQGVGASSDGRAKGMTAPRPEGQILALERAYRKAGIAPATVGLFEAHGTGTAVGDQTEAAALSQFLTERGAAPDSAAVGSVKSMIGHTKATAGVAGLAKVALALYHKVLPPTLGVTRPNRAAGLGTGPLYVNSQSRPWVQADGRGPRRAGVSAFGFGGTNFHAVLEEYRGAVRPPERLTIWPSELFLFTADTCEGLAAEIDALARLLAGDGDARLCDLAFAQWGRVCGRSAPGEWRLALVARSPAELAGRLDSTKARIADGASAIEDPAGIFLGRTAPRPAAELAFLFPGQGSQYPGMLAGLALLFEEVRAAFDRADGELTECFAKPLSHYVFPPPAFTEEDARAQADALTATNVAQPALGAASIGALRLLTRLGLRPGAVAGHSYGEYVALAAAGVLSERNLAVASEARGRFIIESANGELGGMIAVLAPADEVARLLAGLEGVWLANYNAPRQIIVSGTTQGIAQAGERLRGAGLDVRALPVACGFHSPLVARAKEALAALLAGMDFCAPAIPVFSNALAAPYPSDPAAIHRLLAEHLVSPVRFADEIEAMHAAGARVFVEVGPGNRLTGLVRQILDGRSHTAVAIDVPEQQGLPRLHQALAQLYARGFDLDLEPFFESRPVQLPAVAPEADRPASRTSTSWLVDGGSARPVGQAPKGLRPVPLRAGPLPPTAPVPGVSPAEVPTLPAITPATPPAGLAAGTSAGTLPASAAAAAGAAHVELDAVHQVMAQHQALMARFLKTQQQVMLACLGVPMAESGQPAAGVGSPATALGLPTGVVAPAMSDLVPAPATPPAAAERIGSLAAQATGVIQAPPAVPSPAEIPGNQAAATPGAAPPPARRLDAASLTARLLDIVSERTGYPTEMLGLDLDLEADLGIDSIKRVEILGTFQQAFAPGELPASEGLMERLAGRKTLRGIVELAATPSEPAPAATLATVPGGTAAAARGQTDPIAAASPAPMPAEPAEGPVDEARIGRYVLEPVAAPMAPDPLVIASDRTLWITDDGTGVATALAQALRTRGLRPVLLCPSDALAPIGPGHWRADLTAFPAVAELAQQVRAREGRPAALIHLAPLSPVAAFGDMDLAAFRARLRLEVKGLFYLAKALAPDLQDAGAAGGACLLAATSMSRALADASRPAAFPGQKGVAGLVKTLALEWPQVRVRMVDLCPLDGRATWVEQLTAEILETAGPVEVAHAGAHRVSWLARPRPVEQRPSGVTRLGPEAVVLLTGGARGITARVARRLAERHRPTLILVGRSPHPPAEEAAATARLVSPKDLKAALIAAFGARGEPVALAEVEKAHGRLLAEREVRATLDALRASGAQVQYHQADVRDETSFGGLLDRVYAEHGRLDLVIHGAGVIEDKLIADKTPESFDRTFDTKADSAFLLARKLRPESLGHLIFFSSVSGVFGNRGQGDYAAANEVLCGLAARLDAEWPARVVAINWGPWDSAGMVSPVLRRQFEERGIDLIPPALGLRRLEEELAAGAKGEAAVVIGGVGWGPTPPAPEAAAPAAADPAPSTASLLPLPMLGTARPTRANGSFELVRELCPRHDLFLDHHRMNGNPVLPLAAATELLAETVAAGWPDWTVVGLRDLSMFKGVILESERRAVRVLAHPEGAASGGDNLLITAELRAEDPEAPARPFYRAGVLLGRTLPPPPARTRSTISGGALPADMAELYPRWFFHGPLFQGIRRVEAVGREGMAGLLEVSSPRDFFAGPTQGEWLVDPLVLDSGLQMLILWSRIHWDMTCLPARFVSYRRFAAPITAPVHCEVVVRAHSGSRSIHADLVFRNAAGEVFALLEDMEGNCSRELNRLAAAAAHMGSGDAR